MDCRFTAAEWLWSVAKRRWYETLLQNWNTCTGITVPRIGLERKRTKKVEFQSGVFSTTVASGNGPKIFTGLSPVTVLFEAEVQLHDTAVKYVAKPSESF